MGDWHATDQLIAQMAALRGEPLLQVEPGPALQSLTARIEGELGLTVLCRPHTFGKRNVLGNADFADSVVTVFCHPDFPEAESMEVLLHEAGHVLLHRERVVFDRSTIGGYFACERAADEQAIRLAEGWGYSDLFGVEARREREATLERAEDAAYALTPIIGTDDAFTVIQVCRHLVGPVIDGNIDGDLRTWLGGRAGLSYEDISQLCLEMPHLLAGFDRSLLRGHWSLTSGGPPAKSLYLEARPWLADDWPAGWRTSLASESTTPTTGAGMGHS
jgi:hypothetical protein